MHDVGVRDNMAAIGFAVMDQLPAVVRRLKHEGPSAFPTDEQKNRAIPDETWDALTKAAEEEVPVDQIRLLCGPA